MMHLKYFLIVSGFMFNLKLKNLSGDYVSLDSLYNSGDYIVMGFWHFHCTWCPKVMELFKQMSQDTLFSDKAIFVGVAIDPPRLYPKVKSKIKSYGWDVFLNLFDFNGELKRKVHVIATPTVVVYKKNKGEIFRWIGWHPELKGKLRKILLEE